MSYALLDELDQEEGGPMGPDREHNLMPMTAEFRDRPIMSKKSVAVLMSKETQSPQSD